MCERMHLNVYVGVGTCVGLWMCGGVICILHAYVSVKADGCVWEDVYVGNLGVGDCT